MAPSSADRVAHILQAIAEIRRTLDNETLETFTDNFLKRMAIERLFEIISEASRHVPSEVKSAHPNIHWRRLADLGNTLRHAYFRVDSKLLWNFVRNELDPLRKAVESMSDGEEE